MPVVIGDPWQKQGFPICKNRNTW